MRATFLNGARDITLNEVPQPQLNTSEGASGKDAIVRVVAACVCGSDLWGYRGITETSHPKAMGHEFVGVVEQIGSAVSNVKVGDFVIAPFYICDYECLNCRNGYSVHCLHGGWWGGEPLENEGPSNAGQGEYIRVPLADGCLVPVPGGIPEDEALLKSLLTLSDVMGTGHHAAKEAGVTTGKTVAVVGDGAVGLCAVLASKRLGASRIVAMSRHEQRSAIARQFGATDIVPERGDEGIAILKEMFDGIGPDIVLECVGTKESMDQALRSARPGGQVGFVGVPNGGPELPVRYMFDTNVGVRGGCAPVRNYIEELIPEVLSGAINPGLVFDLVLPLEEVAQAYSAMDERRATKVMLIP